ncbi:MAG TPA: hypothetical protein PKC24_13905 [Cyclobacteriaceae bacterium]|nr:hypothetical protein [Cyclobacteriaceae bacterium]
MNTVFEEAGLIAGKKIFVGQNFKRAKTLSLAYIRYRVLRPMLKVYNLLLKINTSKSPWMSPAAIRIFKSILHTEMRGFEYGSGSSTAFFAEKCKEMVSLEHHEEWYQKVKTELDSSSIQNVHYHLVKARQLQADVQQESLINKALENALDDFPDVRIMYEFHDYYSFIDRFENAYFDFVIVDGRARLECVWHAMPKIKAGGFIVLDNAERNRYKAVHHWLRNWKKVFTTTGLTDTVFWFKPHE